MNRQRKADLLLTLSALFWGTSYFLSDLCLTDMQPMTLNAFRFLAGFGVLFLCFLPRMRKISFQTIKFSVIVGLCLTMVYICCTYGLLYTSISNAGFICALAVVITPVLDFAFSGKRPSRNLLAALLLCTLGLALLTLKESFRPALGDILCFGCSLFYSIDLLITEHAVRKPEVDPLQMGVCEIGVVGVTMLLLAVVLEEPHLPTTPVILVSALFLGIFCSGICFVIQTTQQKYTSASHVGLIFTLEPVFSAIVAYFFANEVLGIQGYIGAVLMLSSLLIMEVDFKALKQLIFKREKRP